MDDRLSDDQERVKRLKQQIGADEKHDWQECYDEQGRLIRLSLERLDLSQLPGALGKFTHLQELDLSHNRLASIPSELA